VPPFPIYDDDTREGLRRAALAGHEGDLWVFGYGSLIWDPALEFAEVRRAFAPNHRRRFILEDIYGGRGTPTAPGPHGRAG
jgi:cation transport protein ChaC